MNRKVTLLYISLACVVPMAANLQMIFYKNAKDSVLVKFMLNERDVMLSPVGQVIYGTHYYSWNAWNRVYTQEGSHIYQEFSLLLPAIIPSIEMADKELGVIMAKGYLPGIAYHSGGYSSYCVNIRPLVRCDIKDEQVKLTIVVPNYEVTKVDDGIWSAMLDEDFDKHPPYTVNETWSLNVCFPFAKKDGTKKTSSKASAPILHSA
jgi:hypothetical protein